MNSHATRETAELLSAVLAPVFLISGLGILINTMAQRYARVIDHVQQRIPEARAAHQEALRQELRNEVYSLYARARTLRTTIIAATVSVFFITMTMFFLFASMMYEVPIRWAPEICFQLGLVSMILSLAIFIRDFAVSLQNVKAQIRRGLADP